MNKKMVIRLRKFGRLCPITGYKEASIKVGSAVVVQTDRGLEFGHIVEYSKGLPKKLARDVRLKKVLRYATNEDMETERGLALLEEEAKMVASKTFGEHEAKIKFIDAEYMFDKNRVIVYYKVEGGKIAPNLRELRSDLSKSLQLKVDLRQVNPRDEAMMRGGLGPCGRPLCCAAWLEKPRHVTVKMVKDQGLQISPTKTSGMCGRLLCCLEYESQLNKKDQDSKEKKQ